MPSPPQKSVGTAGNILLVEEYEALAIAFGSALRKVAPEAEIHVARSLAEAEIAATEREPALLVLDLDPPSRGTVVFFNRMKSAIPNTRVLIVAASRPPELTEESAGRSAFHFIEKPFEMATFGRVVHSLLESGGQAGTLRDVTLTDLIQLHGVTGATVVLKVDATGGRSGEIHFAEGRIAHAAVMGQSGIEALQTILGWRSPRFGEAERRADAARTIHGPWATVLSESLRATRPAEQPALPKKPEAVATPDLPTRRIVVIDDTELLLIFVEEVLSGANSALEIVTAHSGLEGLKRVEEVQPDLLLLDYSLPDVTGGEVCRRLLENESTARIPIIMMSGHVPEMMRVAERFDNIVATIAKPFRSAALIDLVDRTLADLPRLQAQRREKKARTEPPPVAVVEALPKIELKKSRNGKRAAAPKSPVRPPEPPAQSVPAPEENAEDALPIVAPVADEPVRTEPAAVEPVAQEEEAQGEPLPDLSSAKEESEPVAAPPPIPSSPVPAGIPAAIHTARMNVVVLGLPLEVVAIQFSLALRMTEIRARPFSPIVSINVLPLALPGLPVPRTVFELARVDLDAHGQIDAVRLRPTREPAALHFRFGLSVDGVTMAPKETGEGLQLTPTAVAPMRMLLLALFELSGVELADDFSVSHLVLKSRGEKMRATLLPEAGRTGATFAGAKFLLDRTAGLAEILLQTAAA